MRKIKIISDSTVDLPLGMLESYEIDIVPLHILLGEQDHLDDKSLTSTDLFRYADEHNTLPKSAAVNEFQFKEVFEKWIERDYDIFFMGISSKLSSTMQSAINASKNFDQDRISIVDSLSLSTGTALQVLTACDLVEMGASLKEITENAIRVRDKVQASFVVDTLKYLYMGGRCSKLVSIMGSRLKIKPKLELIDGSIIPTSKFRGKGYVKKYYAQVMERVKDIDPKRIFITHCLAEGTEELKQQLKDDFGFENVYITEASATISTHCGPNTLGILYMYK